jgi:CCR4-NOT transcription complex subunit 1
LLFLRKEGEALGRIAASTASELIQKDFANSLNSEAMMETAAVLTKQLAGGLTLFTIYQRLHRFLCHRLLGDFIDNDFMNATIQANHTWVSQMLGDIVHLRAWKAVQQRLEQVEESKRKEGIRYRSMVSPGPAPTEFGIDFQQQTIYQDLGLLPLSPAELFTSEAPEKVVKPIPEFEDFFNALAKSIGPEPTADASDEAHNLVLAQCPAIPQEFDGFLAVLRSVLRHMGRFNHQINDRIYAELLRCIVASVPRPFITRSQPFVLQWLRHSIPSVALLCVVLNLSLLTFHQLDRFFFDNLNRHPFNARLLAFAVRFLRHAIVENKPPVPPTGFILSLSLVRVTPQGAVEQATQIFLEELRTILSGIEAPQKLVAVGSPLESFSTFDALEELETEPIASTFGRLREAISGDEYDFVCQVTGECCALGRDGFIWAIEREPPDDFRRFLRCVRETGKLHSAWPDISTAVIFCVRGSSLVLNFDMRRFFDVIWFLLSVCIDDEELVAGYVLLLHELRPLVMPMFGFSWVQLVGDRRLLHELLVRLPNGHDFV